MQTENMLRQVTLGPYRNLLNQSDVATMEVNFAGELLFVNQRAKRLFGIEKDPAGIEIWKVLTDAKKGQNTEPFRDWVRSRINSPPKPEDQIRGFRRTLKYSPSLQNGNRRSPLVDVSPEEVPVYMECQRIGTVRTPHGLLLVFRDERINPQLMTILQQEGPRSTFLKTAGIGTFIKKLKGDLDAQPSRLSASEISELKRIGNEDALAAKVDDLRQCVAFEYVNQVFIDDWHEHVMVSPKGDREILWDCTAGVSSHLSDFDLYKFDQAYEYYTDDLAVFSTNTELTKIEGHPDREKANLDQEKAKLDQENENLDRDRSDEDSSDTRRLVQVYKYLDYVSPDASTKMLFGFFWDAGKKDTFVDLLIEHWVLLRDVCDNLPINVFRKDTDRKCTFASAKYCALLGRKRHQVIGLADEDLHPNAPENVKKYREDDDKVFKNAEDVTDIETHIPGNDPNRTPQLVYVMKHAIHDTEGTVSEVAGQQSRSGVTPARKPAGLQGEFFFVKDLEKLIDQYHADSEGKKTSNELKADVFISYSRSDVRFLEGDESTAGLIMHLDALKGTHFIRYWYDRVLLGQKFDPAIEKRINECRIIICLLSPHYLRHGGYVLDSELKALLIHARNGARVFPVMVSNVVLEAPRNSLVAELTKHSVREKGRPLDQLTKPDQHRTWNELCEDIRIALEETGRWLT